MENYMNQIYTQTDLELFIKNKSEESTNREFKSGEALQKTDGCKKEIAKDVSAFANADGGIIVYGIAEKEYKADSFVFVNGNEITKEWLEDVISSRIQRSIEKLTIDPIRIDGKVEQTIYVVKIPRSLNAPHMTSDKRFYKRRNFKSQEMEEYEVREIYNRKGKTSLQIAPSRISGYSGAMQGDKLFDFSVEIEFNIANNSQVIEKLYKLEIRIPRLISILSNVTGHQYFFKYLVRNEDIYSIFSIPNKSPLFQNENTTMERVTLKINHQNLQVAYDYDILMKLFYSGGIEEQSISLGEYLTFRGKPLEINSFRQG